MQDVHLVHRQRIDCVLDVGNLEPVAAHVQQQASVRVLGLVADRHRRKLRVPGGAGAVLEEELREGLQAAEDAGRRRRHERGMALGVDVQGVRLVDGAVERLEGLVRVVLRLHNLQRRDALPAQRRFEINAARAQHPRHEALLEDCAKGAREAALDNLLAVKVRSGRRHVAGRVRDLLVIHPGLSKVRKSGGVFIIIWVVRSPSHLFAVVGYLDRLVNEERAIARRGLLRHRPQGAGRAAEG